MTAAARQEFLIGQFALIDDPHERFQALVSGEGPPGWMKEECREENLVPGCVSRVWLGTRDRADGTVEFAVASESPALQGLGGHLARIHSGATVAEVEAIDGDLLERLGVARFLTPTRQRGLRHIRQQMLETIRARS